MDHRDGDEHNDAPDNLRYLCKSCNTRLGLAMARTGRGRRVRQYNPAIPDGWYLVVTSEGGTVVGRFRDQDDLPGDIAAGPFDTRDEAMAAQKEFRQRSNPPAKGATSLGQWLTAVLSMKGESTAMTVPAAVEMIRATPPARRSAYGKEVWYLRRQRGTDKSGSGVPF